MVASIKILFKAQVKNVMVSMAIENFLIFVIMATKRNSFSFNSKHRKYESLCKHI